MRDRDKWKYTELCYEGEKLVKSLSLQHNPITLIRLKNINVKISGILSR